MAYGIIIYGGASTYYEGSNVVFKSLENYSQDVNITPGAFVDTTQTSFLTINEFFYYTQGKDQWPQNQILRDGNVDNNIGNYVSFLPNSNKKYAYVSKYEVNKYLIEQVKSIDSNNKSVLSLGQIPKSVDGVYSEIALDSGRVKLASQKGGSKYRFIGNTNSNILTIDSSSFYLGFDNAGYFLGSKNSIKDTRKNFYYNILSSYLDWYSGSIYYYRENGNGKVFKIDKPLDQIMHKLTQLSGRTTQNLKDPNEFIIVSDEAYKYRNIEILLFSYIFEDPDLYTVLLPVTITHRG